MGAERGRIILLNMYQLVGVPCSSGQPYTLHLWTTLTGCFAGWYWQLNTKLDISRKSNFKKMPLRLPEGKTLGDILD